MWIELQDFLSAMIQHGYISYLWLFQGKIIFLDHFFEECLMDCLSKEFLNALDLEQNSWKRLWLLLLIHKCRQKISIALFLVLRFLNQSNQGFTAISI